MDGDFQREPRELTWREREVMIRDAHRRWTAQERKADSLLAHVAALRGPETTDPIDELLEDPPLSFEVADIDTFGGEE